MGNVETADAFSGVDELKDSLCDLETRLASIEAGHRQALRDAELDADSFDGPAGLRPSDAGAGGGDMMLCGAFVVCDRTVTILTGPVVGLVSGDSARILLEVDKDDEITCHVCLIDENCPQGREVAKMSQIFTARRPAVFQLTKLMPGERYVVCFSGVRRNDALTRIADFHTLNYYDSRHDFDLRLLTVSGDRPEAMSPGEFNIWETIFERVRQRHLPTPSLMIHAGGQVNLQEAFEAAWVLLRRHDEYLQLESCGGGAAKWEELEVEAAEKFRAAYRFTWNLPFTREVLATVPHLMIPGEADIYPNFNRDRDLSSDVGGHVAASVIRLARRVYWEYQRQLWDPEVPVLVGEDEEISRRAARALDLQRLKERKERAMERAEQAVAEMRAAKLSSMLIEEAVSIRDMRKSDLDAAKAEALGATAESNDDPTVCESCMLTFGLVGILCVDTRLCALSIDGNQLPNASQPFLPQSFWNILDRELDR